MPRASKSSRIARTTLLRSPRTPAPLLLNTAATRATYCRRRIARDELLDQLLRYERPDVGMVEHDVDRVREIGAHRQIGRRTAVDERLRREVVILRTLVHRAVVVSRIQIAGGRPRRQWIRPARENVGESLDVVLRVARDRLAVAVEERSAIQAELDGAEREQLQELARIVLVRLDARRRIGLQVVDHVEVAAHCRRQGHLGQQVPEIAERLVGKNLLIPLHRVRETDLGTRGDEDLRPGERHALSELVRGGERVDEKFALQLEERVIVALAVARGRQWQRAIVDAGVGTGRRPRRERGVAGGRHRELLLDPKDSAHVHHVRDRRVVRAERRLLQQAYGVGFSLDERSREQ